VSEGGIPPGDGGPGEPIPGASPPDEGSFGSPIGPDETGAGADPLAAEQAAPGRARHGRRRRHRTRRRVLFGVAAAVVLLIIAVVAWYLIEAFPLGGPGQRVVVEVTQGEGTSQVANSLEQRGVVGSALALRLSFVLHGSPTIDPGGYVFHTNQSFSTVRSILSHGPDLYDVNVLPGYTVAEVTQAVGAVPGRTGNDFAAVVRSGTVRSSYGTTSSISLEGLLGTGTYQVTVGESDTVLLAQMVNRFEKQAAAAGVNSASAQALGMTPYQVVIVASIAQKEGYFDRYFGKVSRVVYNRLAAGMHLDMTSTVLYAIGQDGGTVTKADHTLDTPYNTYLNAGLPPTPICIPSPAALAAAVSPPAGTWLYFTVVDKAGTTRFAVTYTEQLANEQLAQKNGVG
jgi:UPF0755 protein